MFAVLPQSMTVRYCVWLSYTTGANNVLLTLMFVVSCRYLPCESKDWCRGTKPGQQVRGPIANEQQWRSQCNQNLKSLGLLIRKWNDACHGDRARVTAYAGPVTLSICGPLSGIILPFSPSSTGLIVCWRSMMSRCMWWQIFDLRGYWRVLGSINLPQNWHALIGQNT